MKTVKVNLQKRSYNIHIKTDLLPESGKYIKELNIGKKIFKIGRAHV